MEITDPVNYDNDRVFRLDELILDVIEEYDEKRMGEYREPVLPTGFPALDKLLGGGFRPGTVNVIASRPGMGKTALALEMARNMAEEGNVLYYSNDASANMLARRILCAEAAVEPRALNHGDPWADPDLHDAEADLCNLPLFIYSAPGLPYDDIDRKILGVGGVRALFVDNLQCAIPRCDTHRDLTDETQEAMLRFNEIAKRFDIPVIVMSRISRSRDDISRLAGLQIENEAIERNAHTVMFIRREKSYAASPKKAANAELILAKNAFGDVGKSDLLWSERTSSFFDPASESEHSRWMEELASDDDLPF